MNHIERITMDPEICHGRPVIRRMRYPVELILDLLSSGMTIEAVLIDYEDLLAVLSFAARLSQIKRIDSVLA